MDAGRRGNFRGIRNLSYSYAQPFTSALKYRLDDNRRSSFALMADRNPGKAHGRDVRAVRENDPPLKLAMGNSRNHRGAGQNVLFASGNVEFTTTPYCGDGRSPTSTGDNIFTALRPVPLEVENPPANEAGVLGRMWGPPGEMMPTSCRTTRRDGHRHYRRGMALFDGC